MTLNPSLSVMFIVPPHHLPIIPPSFSPFCSPIPSQPWDRTLVSTHAAPSGFAHTHTHTHTHTHICSYAEMPTLAV